MSQFTNPNNIQSLWSMLINQPPFNTFHPSSLNIQTIRTIFESNLNPFFSQYNNKQILASDFTNINNGFIHTLIKFIHSSRPDLLTLQEAPQSYHPPPQHPPPQKMGSNTNPNERPGPINTRTPNAYSQTGGTKEDYKTQNRDSLNNAVASRAGEYITKQESTTSQQNQSDNGPVFEQSIPPTPSIEVDDIQKLIMQRNYDVNPDINPNVVHQPDNDNDDNVNNNDSLNGPTYLNQTASLINDSGMNAEHMRMLEKHEKDIEQLNNKLDNIQKTLTELSEFIIGKPHKKQKKTPPTPQTPQTSPTQYPANKKQKTSDDK